MDPALNKIWHTVPTLEPLFKLFPRSSWGVWESKEVMVDEDDPDDRESFYIKQFEFSRPLRCNRDWARLRFYAARVHSLTHYHDAYNQPDWAVSKDAFVDFHEGCPSNVFPRLKEFTWKDYRGSAISYAPIFLVSSLSKLSIDIKCNSPATIKQMNELAPRIYELCPNLRSLSIPPLRSVTIRNVRDICPDTLTQLGYLPGLEALSLAFPSEKALNLPQQPSFFSSLRSLEFFAYKTTSALSLLAAISSRGLTTLQLTVTQQSCSLALLHKLCQAVARFPNLSHLSIVFARTGEPESVKASQKSIAPLRSLKKLLSLTIEATALQLDDATLHAIATAFPSLTKLAVIPLGDDQSDRWTSSVTMAGLNSLAEGCPNLRDLSIIFDARASPRAIEPNSTKSNLSLTYLNTGNSPADDPEVLTRFLTSCFPNLQKIRTWFQPRFLGAGAGDLSEEQQCWDEVLRSVTGVGLEWDGESFKARRGRHLCM
ncbi:hypothetical protein HGRIS_005322 [Hohenbuehelia grisea]|uniref:Uncharacterized protein n=1 Tax=Hohenbuehelia grisea TaxID=104357 RepID=A0ABR3JEQ6_9AGAR